MTVTTVFDQLERLLPQVSKPIQYVGGELGAVVKDWDSRRRAMGADVPRRVRGRPAQPGRADPVRGAQRAARRAGRADVRGLARPRERSCASTASRSSPSTRTGPVRAFDLFGISFATELGYTNMLTALRPGRDPASTPATAATRTRSWSPAGTPPSTRSRSPTSSTPRCSATVRRRCWRSPTSSGPGRPRAARAGATSCCCAWPAPRPSTCPRFYDVDYLPDGRIQRVVPNRADVPFRDPQAHHHGPRRVAVPAQAAGAAGRDRARAVRGRDLPRLHPGLPVLPGGHDHPTGARTVDHHRRPDGARRPGVLRLLRGRAALAVQRGPLRDRRHVLRPGRPVRGHQRVAVAAVDPGRRVQRHPGRGAVAQRPAHRAHLRPRGWLRADPSRDQQDGVGRGPHPYRRHRVHQRLAQREALLHVRPAHRDRRRRRCRSPGSPTR